MFKLRIATSEKWTEAVLADFDRFLNDHAAAERKASGMAMSMALQYKDKPDLVSAMIDLAIEELAHFREVVKLMRERGIEMLPDIKDKYVNTLRNEIRSDARNGSTKNTGRGDVARSRNKNAIDRLVVASIIEARGAERFGLIAAALPEEEAKLKTFYQAITDSEDKHRNLFIDLAHQYFNPAEVDQRLHYLLDVEARIIQSLPFNAYLH